MELRLVRLSFSLLIALVSQYQIKCQVSNFPELLFLKINPNLEKGNNIMLFISDVCSRSKTKNMQLSMEAKWLNVL